MTVLLVLGGLLVLLVVACWCEARSGKPAWGEHLRTDGPTTRDASKAAKTSLAVTLATATFLGLDGGGDG